MNLIFIYGPPAVGKLSVAKELEKVTGYKLFHNHMARDFATSIINEGIHNSLFEKICLDVFEETSKTEMKGLIFTFVYGAKVDDLFVEKVKKILKSNKGRLLFVQLKCKEDELLDRVKNISRQNTEKVKDPIKLKKMLTEYDLLTPIIDENSLIIENTEMSPQAVANMIKSHYQL